MLWDEGRIRISKRWAKGKDGETKTEALDGGLESQTSKKRGPILL
jgi:hypothetical protein